MNTLREDGQVFYWPGTDSDVPTIGRPSPSGNTNRTSSGTCGVAQSSWPTVSWWTRWVLGSPLGFRVSKGPQQPVLVIRLGRIEFFSHLLHIIIFFECDLLNEERDILLRNLSCIVEDTPANLSLLVNGIGDLPGQDINIFSIMYRVMYVIRRDLCKLCSSHSFLFFFSFCSVHVSYKL